jgi:hypothetical protein
MVKTFKQFEYYRKCVGVMQINDSLKNLLEINVNYSSDPESSAGGSSSTIS